MVNATCIVYIGIVAGSLNHRSSICMHACSGSDCRLQLILLAYMHLCKD